MTIHLELPLDVEQAYLAEARTRGLALEALVSEVLVSRRQAIRLQPRLPPTSGSEGSTNGSPAIRIYPSFRMKR